MRTSREKMNQVGGGEETRAQDKEREAGEGGSREGGRKGGREHKSRRVRP